MSAPTKREISCRITKTLLMYVQEANNGSLGELLHGLELDEEYLSDINNWVSHSFLQVLYHRMTALLDDPNAVYKMALASERFQSLGFLDRVVRLVGNPRYLYAQTPRYNRLLKLNGDVYVHGLGNSWVMVEDRYHDSSQKTRYDCDYTRGIFAAIPSMFGLPFANVEEIECQVSMEAYGERLWPDNPRQGSRGCLYRVQWDYKGKAPFWKRFLVRQRIYRQAMEDLLEAHGVIQEKYSEASRLASDLEAANIELTRSKQLLESKTADLIASERRYRLLAENVTDIIWIFNLGTMRFTYVSPSVQRVRGHTQQEAMGMTLQESVSPESLEKLTRVLNDELARDNNSGVDPGRSLTVELQQLSKDGSYRWVEVKANFVRDDEGRPVGLLGVSRDISGRKKAEDALRKSEERLKAIFHAAKNISFVITDVQKPEPVVLEFSPGAEKIFGYTRSEMIGAPVSILHLPEDVALFADVHERMRQGKEGFSGEIILRRKSGQTFPAIFTTYPLVDEKGEMYAALRVSVDISDRIRLESQLRHSQKMEAIGTLAGGVAHDFNNILGIILGYAELALEDARESCSARQNLEEIRTAGMRAKSVVRQLLNFSRQVEQKLIPIDITPIIKESAKLLRASIPSTVSIKTDIEKRAFIVRADPSQVHQVVINLCANAAHAMEKNGGTLEVSLKQIALNEALSESLKIPAGSYAHLTVTDNGHGIPPEIKERIFEPYFTTKEVGKGTGLGLAVAHNIVQSHEGAISVVSAPGEGTRVEVYLPICDEEVASEPEPSGKLPPGKERILVVDDEESLALMAQQILERLGYRVVAQTDPVKALDLFRSAPDQYDLIITDMTMPGLTGAGLATEALAIRHDIPVILCTGFSKTMNGETARRIGIRKYVEKPLETRELALAVREVLDEPSASFAQMTI